MRWGIRPGMPLAEARGLSSGIQGEVSSATGLITELYEPATDRATLQALALQCQTYSPLVALEESEHPDSLLLDITGCECHFGGEESLARQLWNEFSASRYHTRIAIADTIGAAWAMAHFGVEAPHPVAVIPAGQHPGTLRRLPVAGLRLAPRILQTLHKLDLRVIGQLEKLPRSTLPSRFGKELLRRLDQAWGTVHELITPERLREPLSAVWSFDEAVKDRRTLELVAQDLLNHKILAQLNPRQAGIRELRCDLRGTVDALTLTLRLLQSSLDQKHLWDLLRLEWDRREAAFRRSPQAAPRCFTEGIMSVRLEVAETAPLKIRQTTLFDLEPGRKEAVAFQHFVERLSSRLGSQSVVRPQPVPDAQPELACEYPVWGTRPVGLTSAVDDEWQAALARTRPTRLLATPEPLRVLTSAPGGEPLRIWWRDQQFQIVHAWGPERIETGWWREADIRRDYYRVETGHGYHLWIFRCRLTDRWFVHGTYE